MQADGITIDQLTRPKTHQHQAKGHVGEVLWHAAPQAQDLRYWLRSRWQASEASRGTEQQRHMQRSSSRFCVWNLTASFYLFVYKSKEQTKINIGVVGLSVVSNLPCLSVGHK